MRIHLLLAGLFLLLAVAKASVPAIEIKASISTIFRGIQEANGSLTGIQALLFKQRHAVVSEKAISNCFSC